MVETRKLNLGGLHEVSRTTGDRLREPSLAKARKFGLTQTTKPHSLPFSRRSKFICDPRPAQSQPKPPAPFLLKSQTMAPFLGMANASTPSLITRCALPPGGVAAPQLGGGGTATGAVGAGGLNSVAAEAGALAGG